MEIALEPPCLIVKPGVSEEEFYRLAGEDSDWEYLDGRIVMHSPATNRHEDLFRFLLTLFSAFLDDRGGGIVRGSGFPMRLDARWSPEPDLLIVTGARGAQLTDERLDGPADLVVEIVSESDPGLDYREKLPRYREAGITGIWIVDRFRQEVLRETRTETGYRAETLPSGRLSCAVVPGFWIDVSWLWQEKLPSTLDCLRQIMGPALSH
jgi:Uma2 family endonuclease